MMMTMQDLEQLSQFKTNKSISTLRYIISLKIKFSYPSKARPSLSQQANQNLKKVKKRKASQRRMGKQKDLSINHSLRTLTQMMTSMTSTKTKTISLMILSMRGRNSR